MPNPLAGEKIANLGEDKEIAPAFVSEPAQPVQRGQSTSDPVLDPAYVQPADYTAQYPNPLDPLEILVLCEEITLWKALPEVRTQLSTYYWREMDNLQYSSGTTTRSYLPFQDGYCPNVYEHAGDNYHVNIKNIGVKKSLSVRDIMNSAAIAGNGGIAALLGGPVAGEGLPGAYDAGTFAREAIRDVKAKEIRLGETLVLNGWDDMLIQGNSNSNSLAFDGIENYFSNVITANCFHYNDNSASGTFSATSFDRFLSEGCAVPTALLGHPAAIQELMSAYFQLGFQGSQLINFQDGNRITPGFNFASFVNTGVGRLQVIADSNFTRGTPAASTTQFQADIWALRMTHNGEPLVYKITQIPLSYQDLAPGCTAISFEIWAATALVIKMCCAQSKYTSIFTGRVTTTCTVIA